MKKSTHITHGIRTTLSVLATGLALAAGALVSGNAAAQAYPSKPITLNSSLGPGSSYDAILRAIQEDWQARTGKTFIINPVLGALGTLAPASLKRAEPDGHTLAFTFSAPLSLSPLMMSAPPYDTVKDIAPVILLTRHGLIYSATPTFPANNFAELITYAKANPGKVSIGIAGAGSQVHILQIASAMGAEFLPVPYKASTQLAPAAMSGEVNVISQTVGATAELIRAGRLKPLFIAQKTRAPQLPNVPALAETNPGLEGGSWFAIVAPAGTPKDRIDWLNREFAISMKTPRAQASAQASAYEVMAGPPEQLADLIKSEIAINSKIVKQYNLKAD